MRLTFQEAMADEFKQVVAGDGPRVIAYHSQLTLDPDLGFEFFVLVTSLPADAARPRSCRRAEEVRDRHRREHRRAEARRARREQKPGVEAAGCP